MRQMNPAITISPQIEDTVTRCMAKDPDQRFRSMDEVLAALKRIGAVGALTGTMTGVGTGEYRSSSLSGSGSGPQVANGIGIGANPAFLSPSMSDVPSPLGRTGDAAVAGALLASQMPGKVGSKSTLVTAVIGALACAGLIAYIAVRPRAPAAGAPPLAQNGSAAQSGAVLAAPGATDAVPAAPSPLMVKVRINTEPDGASVKEDGVELCSSTPCDILYKGADADAAKEHRLTLLRAGYRSETKSVRVGDSPVSVKLAAMAVAPRYVPPQAAPPGKSEKSESPSLPPGYKPDIPY